MVARGLPLSARFGGLAASVGNGTVQGVEMMK
jgi:hypothetical protein